MLNNHVPMPEPVSLLVKAVNIIGTGICKLILVQSDSNHGTGFQLLAVKCLRKNGGEGGS